MWKINFVLNFYFYPFTNINFQSTPDGMIFPKGTNLGLGPFFMARDSSLWENPLDFIPERFSAEAPQMHPYLYIPFSAGPR
jgi:cytochrome P450 family 4